jgi:cellulose synthase/poly-beta-1,6-N-acetylglucosamine synthase-like glycosyltransferase
MVGFYTLASLVIIQGLVALWGGVRFLKFVRQSLDQPPADYAPKVAVIAPCKGIDPGFRENIRSLLGQDYPDYEVIFVTESTSDPASGQIDGMLREESFPFVTLIEAGRASDRGQKVHNLLAALAAVADDVEVLAFVDSDARVSTRWLRLLVAPLAGPTVGATTGYRWYVPAAGNFCSLLRSLWNASIATVLGPSGKRNFAWGGSTAICRATFEAANIRTLWVGACTDDYVLSNAVKARGLSVRFVPQCLIPSLGECSWGELLQFTTRQIVLTRVYSFGWWLVGCVAHLTFAAGFYAGLGIVAHRQWLGSGLGAPELVLAAMYLPGVLQASLRQRAVEMILSEYQRELRRYRLAYGLLYPLASALFAYNFVVSSVSRWIRWRGVRYKLISPSQTVIVRDDLQESGSLKSQI